MTPIEPDAICDGGDLDCGSGLLLIIRNAMQPLSSGGLLEVRSRETSVKEDLPAWCRMVGHRLVGTVSGEGRYTHYHIRKRVEDGELEVDLKTARDFQWRTRLRWKSGMKAEATVRNHGFTVGQPASFDTEDQAPSAIEFLLSSLGACLTVGFQWRCSRLGVTVRNLEIAVAASADNILVFLAVEDSGHPGLKDISVKAYIDADADEERLAEIWQETIRRSPVAQTLARSIAIHPKLMKVE